MEISIDPDDYMDKEQVSKEIGSAIRSALVAEALSFMKAEVDSLTKAKIRDIVEDGLAAAMKKHDGSLRDIVNQHIEQYLKSSKLAKHIRETVEYSVNDNIEEMASDAAFKIKTNITFNGTIGS